MKKTVPGTAPDNGAENAEPAALPDPAGLFNASLDGNTRRAIDIHEGEHLDAAAFKTLIRAAVAANTAPKPKRTST